MIINDMTRHPAPGLTWSFSAGKTVTLEFFDTGIPPGTPQTRFTIELWEQDNVDSDDHLGTVSFTVDDFDWFDDFWNKIREAKFTGDGADYRLIYKFIDL
ncbi:hypothetical protein ACWGNM_17145 [Streptomyces sp. NPDC055796]